MFDILSQRKQGGVLAAVEEDRRAASGLPPKFAAPAALVGHGEGLPDADGGAQVDAEMFSLLDRSGDLVANRFDVGPRGAHGSHSCPLRSP